MAEKYMRESDVYRYLYDYWEKRKSIADCLDMVPKYEIKEHFMRSAGIEDDILTKIARMSDEDLDEILNDSMEGLIKLGLVEKRGQDKNGNTLYRSTEFGKQVLGPLFVRT